MQAHLAQRAYRMCWTITGSRQPAADLALSKLTVKRPQVPLVPAALNSRSNGAIELLVSSDVPAFSIETRCQMQGAAMRREGTSSPSLSAGDVAAD